MKVIIYSEKGYKKATCEDAALLNEHIISDSFSKTQINSRTLIAIADGVGGNAGGALASRYVLNQFEKIDIDEFREAIKKMFEFREVLSATIDELRKKTGGGENN